MGASLQGNRHSGVFTAYLDEQQRFIDHALSDSGVGLLIVFQETGERSRPEFLVTQSLNKTP
ncbi:MAG: hypothetical protein WCL20_08955, partial [Actinomycetes bacterium]